MSSNSPGTHYGLRSKQNLLNGEGCGRPRRRLRRVARHPTMRAATWKLSAATNSA